MISFDFILNVLFVKVDMRFAWMEGWMIWMDG